MQLDGETHRIFWREFKAALSISEKGSLIHASPIKPQSRLAFPLKKRHVYLSARRGFESRFLGRAGNADEIAVELILDHAVALRNFDVLLSDRSNIERDLGFRLEWRRPDPEHHYHSEIYVLRHGMERDPRRWKADINWLAAKLIKMHEYFLPRVKRFL